jgi:hypothetical protein
MQSSFNRGCKEVFLTKTMNTMEPKFDYYFLVRKSEHEINSAPDIIKQLYEIANTDHTINLEVVKEALEKHLEYFTEPIIKTI